MLDAKRIINGTYGEAWLDDSKVSEVMRLQAKLEIQKEDVKICGKLAQDSKMIGYTGKGSLTLYKVNSRIISLVKDSIKQGKELRFTIISKLADPDSFGTERIVLKGVSFDDLTLADWETAKLGEVEVPFTFSDFDLMDSIEAKE